MLELLSLGSPSPRFPSPIPRCFTYYSLNFGSIHSFNRSLHSLTRSLVYLLARSIARSTFQPVSLIPSAMFSLIHSIVPCFRFFLSFAHSITYSFHGPVHVLARSFTLVCSLFHLPVLSLPFTIISSQLLQSCPTESSFAIESFSSPLPRRMDMFLSAKLATLLFRPHHGPPDDR